MKLTSRLLLILGLCGLSGGLPARAQDRPVPLAIGHTFTLRSAALRETRRINVYLPPGYADSAAAPLPVLYLLDGGLQEDFLHVAGLVQVLTGNGTMRPFILVGLENTQRRRDLTGPATVPADQKIAPRVGGSAAFRQFIRTELMPAIRSRYRTSAETAVVGESLAGLFVVATWLREPALFDTYVAVDPSVWWSQGRLVDQVAPWLRAYAGPAKTVYVASSRDRQRSNPGSAPPGGRPAGRAQRQGHLVLPSAAAGNARHRFPSGSAASVSHRVQAAPCPQMSRDPRSFSPVFLACTAPR